MRGGFDAPAPVGGAADQAVATEAFQRFVATASEPSFLDDLEATWGAPWGAFDEVGPLRRLLMREPSSGLAAITDDPRNRSDDILRDPEGRWYWLDRRPPDLELLRRQHQGLATLLRREGVEVAVEPSASERHTKDMYVRDPMITIPGGAVIGRMGAVMRRGEEASTTRSVAHLGLPILGTITGTGTLEGGSVIKVSQDLVAVGLSARCNREGAHQLRDVLGRLGIEVSCVPLPGHSIHLDLHLAMLAPRRALVRTTLPSSFRQELVELGFELIEAHPAEPWGPNLLCLCPNRVVIADGSPRTAERLWERGVEVLTVPYDEVHKNGGGVHCSTVELVRDRAE
jgi:N-dimethylarginine dimethylaminohydrolase